MLYQNILPHLALYVIIYANLFIYLVDFDRLTQGTLLDLPLGCHEQIWCLHRVIRVLCTCSLAFVLRLHGPMLCRVPAL